MKGLTILQTGRNNGQSNSSGFTLLEVVAVMAIIAMIALFALPNLQRGTTRRGTEELALRLASVLKADRYVAIRNQTNVTTSINLMTREVQSGATKRKFKVPADVNIKTTVSENCRTSSKIAGIIFYPDGRSCGGEIRLERPGVSFEVQINWLTGGVQIVAL